MIFRPFYVFYFNIVKHRMTDSNRITPDVDNMSEKSSIKQFIKKKKVIELIEIDGKRVSKTATGKRKFHKKSKNGCDNCKRRRVKCDETKPHCLKCIKIKLDCIYTPVRPRKNKGTSVETLMHYTSNSLQDEKIMFKDDSRKSDIDTPNDGIHRSLDVDTGLRDINVSEFSRQQHLDQQKNYSTMTSFDSSLSPQLPSGITMQHLHHQLQQQPHLLPQLMTLSNSEKYASVDIPNTPLPQSMNMNLTNSIGSMFSHGRFPSNLLGAAMIPSTSLDANQCLQFRNGNIDLKQIGNMFPTAGVGGITYDFQELLGLKSPNICEQPTQDTTTDVLAGLQPEQQQQVEPSVLNTNHIPNLSENPIISSAAPLSPIDKISIKLTDDRHKGRSVNSLSHANNMLENKLMSHTGKEELLNMGQLDSSGSMNRLIDFSNQNSLNLVDLKLFHHYCTELWQTILAAGMSEKNLWSRDIPDLAFEYPFLMHALLAFSASHLSRTISGLEPYVATHRLNALKLLREAVLDISQENTDALVASALILIMDSLANASSPNQTISTGSISHSAWIFHIKGAATVLTAVWPLTEKSRFYNLINVDLSDLGDIINQEHGTIAELVCFDESIADLYPVEIESPYLITLAYLDKLYRAKKSSGFILRIFAFPALLDKIFLSLLMTGDLGAMKIMRSYYKLLRGFTTEMKDKIWFLEGVSQVLPQDVDEYVGGGGMHMMLDFLGGGLPSMTTTNLSDFM